MKRIIVWLLVMALFALSSCITESPPATPELEVPSSGEETVPADGETAPTEEAVADDTPVDEPAEEAAPVNTPLPPIPTKVGPVRIEFAAGETAATVSNALVARGTAEYTLRAFEGQTMQVSVTSTTGNVLPAIVGGDGTVLKQSADGRVDWRGTLPSTQEYTIRLIALGQASDYSMTVTIDPLEEVAPPEPTRIEFAAGATAAELTGTVAPRAIDIYVIRALAGQTMNVVVTADSPDVLLSIVGADGIPLQRYVSGSAEFSGELPLTQDYFIEVWSFVETAQPYTLAVEIPPAEADVPEAPAEPTRIQFAPGAVSATVDGTLAPNGADSYVLQAGAGQLMFVTAGSGSPAFGIRQGGQVLAFRTFIWRGVLPVSADYEITIYDEGSGADYELEVTIVTPQLPANPVRVSFAAGTDSATLTGTSAAPAQTYLGQRYVLGAGAGQTMTIGVTGISTGDGNVLLTIVGADGTYMGTYAGPLGADRLSATLPTSQDYTVFVVSFGGPGGSILTYDMAVSIR